MKKLLLCLALAGCGRAELAAKDKEIEELKTELARVQQRGDALIAACTKSLGEAVAHAPAPDPAPSAPSFAAAARALADIFASPRLPKVFEHGRTDDHHDTPEVEGIHLIELASLRKAPAARMMIFAPKGLFAANGLGEAELLCTISNGHDRIFAIQSGGLRDSYMVIQDLGGPQVLLYNAEYVRLGKSDVGDCLKRLNCDEKIANMPTAFDSSEVAARKAEWARHCKK